MKNKEIITALGVSVALSMTACGAEVQQPAPVEEVTEVAEEEPTPTPSPTPAVEEKEAEEEPEVSENEAKTEAEVQEEVKEEPEEKPEFSIEDIDPVVMYGTQTANVRKGPSTDYDIVRQIQQNEEVTVIGKVKADNGKVWNVLKTDDDSIEMVSSSLLSSKKVSTAKPSNNAGNSGTVAPASSDCVADCEGWDCDSYCSADCFDNWTPTDCDASYCSASYCAQAE